MKTPSEKSPSANGDMDDHDIEQLFRQQNIEVPKALDAAIIAKASAAVNKSGPSSTPVNRNVMQWFALAATIVIGISVTPLLLRSPESSLPGNAPISTEASPQAFDLAAPQDVTRTRSASGSALESASEDSMEIASAPSTTSGPEAVSAPATDREQHERSEQQSQKIASSAQTIADEAKASIEAEESALRFSEQAQTATSVLSGSGRQGGAAGDNSELSSSLTPAPLAVNQLKSTEQLLRYRSDRHRWLAHIRALHADDNLEAVKKEIELFNKAYPNQKPLLSVEQLESSPSQVSDTRPDKPDE